MMLRRDFLGFCALLAFGRYSLAASGAGQRGPHFWVAARGKARVFLLGFAEAKDQSWFRASIQRAFHESSELWLEVGHSQRPEDAELIQQLEHESGRTFFDALEPPVRERTLAYVAALGLKKESVEKLRPWRAFYTINSAFWAQTKQAHEPLYPDQLLRDFGAAQGKRMGHEMPTQLEFAQFMAGMPDAAQSQYIDWLLDFLDEKKQGAYADDFDWEVGKPDTSTRSLDRMRTKSPDLYRVMQAQRNTWWAGRIDQLLAAGQTSFVLVGEMHVFGPDEIPQQLQRRGIAADLVT
jgi:uncharacterized protein